VVKGYHPFRKAVEFRKVMTNVLSQEEVDSLLGGITDGKVKTELEAPVSEEEEGITGFDFTQKATGPMHQRLPTLGIINERVVGFLKKSLSAATSSVVDITIEDIDSVDFGGFSRALPLPTSLNIFKMEPLRGHALLVLEASLVYTFVDSFFGGKSVSNVRLEGKNFTNIEINIVTKIVKLILSDFERAWADVHKVKMVFARAEVDPQFAGIATPEDQVIVIKLNVELENTSGMMTFCIPYSLIEPIREKLRHRFQGEKFEVDEAWSKFIYGKIRGLKMDVNCILGTAKITGRDLLEMKANDILQLDQKISDPIVVNIEGIPKFRGYPGTYCRQQAVRIEERTKKE